MLKEGIPLDLRYGDLRQLLERLHSLPPSREVATESRLKNFSRLSFPFGPRVGSGERAEYGAEQIVQLLVAFELLRHRMPPAAIVEVIRTEWTTIAVAFAASAVAITREASGTQVSNDQGTILLVDAVALHEAGKTVRPGELLTTIEAIAPASLFGSSQVRRRSCLIVDPSAVLRDVVALLPASRRFADPTEFLADVAALSSLDGNAAIGKWMENGYRLRRELADMLAVVRAAQPLRVHHSPRLPETIERRLIATASHRGRQSDTWPLVHGVPLGGALAVYLDWIGVEAKGLGRGATPAETLVLRTKAQTPEALHTALIEAILDAAGAPAQDN